VGAGSLTHYGPPSRAIIGDMEIPSSWDTEAFCYVTTTGRKSGREHTIEIWFGLTLGVFYLLSGGGLRSDWVRNIRAEPRVTVRVGDTTFEAEGRVVEDPTEDALARRLLATKYQGWHEGQAMSGWAQTALPIALTPVI
jgi:deazaflavin-dependent oxidoreductase (nitroreductase family)